MRGAGREVGRGRSRKNRQSESEGGVSGRGGGEAGGAEMMRPAFFGPSHLVHIQGARVPKLKQQGFLRSAAAGSHSLRGGGKGEGEGDSK